jgi:peptidyl-prolyl cis-trans isomerase SurA
MKKIILVVFSIALSSVTLVKAQEQVVDEVVAVVGSKIILKSDIEGQYVQYKMQGNIGNASAMKCQFLESILFEKLLLTQAELDSVQVTDNQVESTMNQRFRYYISQFGSQQKLEEFYQKPILEIKEEIRSLVKDQLMAEQVQSKITENIKITPSEIKAFYNRMPDDSIPFIDTEYEIGQIVKQPPVSAEALSEAKEKLTNLRQRIVKGESFSTLAILYSEDPGSAKKGGELGMFSRGEMYPEFEAVAFGLKPNQVSDIIKTKAGLHILQLIERKGDYVNVRHILIQPKVSPFDLAKASAYLDSIAGVIKHDSISFEKAALKYSDDPGKINGALMVNPQTNTSRFEAKQLDPKVFFVVDKMKVGEISKAVPMTTEEGKQAFQLLYLKVRTDPHKANLKDDYNKIQNWALEEKKGKAIDDWIKSKTDKTYISIIDEFKNCNFQHKWITN